MERYVLLALTKATTMIAIFDLWMSQGCFDMFMFIINYTNKQWETCHIIVGIFEMHETSSATMVVN